jgi:hypothetical protein
MTTPAPTTYEDMQDRREELIFKALEGSIFIAPMSAALPTALTGTAGALLSLPAGWEDIGWVDGSDGVNWSRKVDTSDTDSWGSPEPTRSDINKDEASLKFTMQQTNRVALETYYGLDLTNIQASATNKEIQFAQPRRPATRYFRLFGIFVDGYGADEIYVGRLFTRSNVIDMDDSKWTTKDSVASYGVSVRANWSSSDSFAVKHFIGGPGWASKVENAGFTIAT